MSLENKVVVVTGAGFPNGLGAGIARCFASENAKVVLTDLEGTPLDGTATGISGNVTGLVADATSQEAMAIAADRIIQQHGRIDVLVNNAGGSGSNSGEMTGTSISDELWDAWLVRNLRSTFASTGSVAAKMEDGGSVVNIASLAALSPRAAAQVPAYGAAKAGVTHLTKMHAIQYAPRRIRVNAICPGVVWTRAMEELVGEIKASDPGTADMTARAYFERIAAGNPLRGEQTAEDIGNLAVFLSSDKARMITGAVIGVDGGASI